MKKNKYYVTVHGTEIEISLEEFVSAELNLGLHKKGESDTATGGFTVGPVRFSVRYEQEICKHCGNEVLYSQEVHNSSCTGLSDDE